MMTLRIGAVRGAVSKANMFFKVWIGVMLAAVALTVLMEYQMGVYGGKEFFFDRYRDTIYLLGYAELKKEIYPDAYHELYVIAKSAAALTFAAYIAFLVWVWTRFRKTLFLALFLTLLAYTTAPYTVQKLYIRAAQFSVNAEVFLGPYDYAANEFSNFYGHLKSETFYSQIDDIRYMFDSKVENIVRNHKLENKGLNKEELLDKYQEIYGVKGRSLDEINQNFYKTGQL